MRRRGRLGLGLVLAMMSAAPLRAQPATARHHMAATANPLATDAADSVLRDGGTAADAAIAAQMMLAVVEPQSSGLGGGSLLLVWNARARSLTGYDGLATAPAGLTRDPPRGPDGRPVPAAILEHSGRSVGVPGTLPTLALLYQREGRLPWPRLFRDAIRVASGGFPLPRYLHTVLGEQPELAARPGFGRYFGADRQPLPIGTVIRNRPLAATLRLVASEGPGVLSHGRIAADIVAAVARAPLPGALTPADLAGYRPRLRPPVCLPAFGQRVCSIAPPGGGVPLLEQVGILERLGIAQTAPGSLAAAHDLIEAARLSAADRRHFLGDPDRVSVPVAGLLDPGYLARRAALVMPDRAMAEVAPGNPAGPHAALAPSDPTALPMTTDIAIVDDSGNAVSFTTTINLNFGAHIVVDGIVLNDALTNFASRPAADGRPAADAAAPGKRPTSTMAPTIVFGSDDRPSLVLGAGGGARIIDSVTQTLVGVLAWHQDIRTAIEQPRIGAQTRDQEVERDTPAADLAAPLRAMGHEVRVGPMNAAVQGIAITPGGLQGWGDSHRDGVARGD